jgi:long-chain acyl-CoA synthetase
VIWLLSMSYHFAVSIVGYLTFGAGIVLPPNALGPTVLGAAREFGGTFLYASPLHYSLMAAAPDASPLPTVRLAISTAVPLERDIAEAFFSRFGLPLTQALGIIEVGLPAINVDFAAEHPEAVGRVLPAYRLKLADPGFAADWPEICFQGPGFLDAYYSPWRTRAEIVPDGWFHTGDVGQVDAAGCLFVRGRSKDVINVAGMKFFPQELERVLQTHPAVQEACVKKRPDGRFGEVPHAWVVLAYDGRPRPSAGELLEYCRQRLADFKVPRSLELVECLPRTASGKLLRRPMSPAVSG